MSKKMDSFLAVDKNLLGKGLQPIDILILAQIQEYERSNECYASNQTFADSFGVSTKTVERALDRLEDLKYINRDTKTVSDNGQKSRKRKIKTRKATVNLTVGYEKQPSNCPEATVNLSKSNRQNDAIKEKKKEKEKENKLAALGAANAVEEDKWIPKDDYSKEIFGSDIHTDKKVIEILNKEFGKVEYGIPKTVEDICKEIWVTACNVNTDKIAEYCTEVLMNKGE